MKPADLKALLDVLTEAGVDKARVPLAAGVLEVEFAPRMSAPLVDKDGKPVNLDEGLPWNARDPDIDPLEAANFPNAKTAPAEEVE